VLLLSALKEAVWGIPTLATLTVFSLYFTKKTAFYRISAIKGIIKDTLLSLGKEKHSGVSPIAAVATALGGTVGVGSIVGVGYAISVGGAGSVFWMWVCSFLGMGLKYSEVFVALKGRRLKNGSVSGGAPYRLREMGYEKLAIAFCVLCIAASFGTGNLTQVGAISGFLCDMGVSAVLRTVICVFIIALAVFGGRKRIAGINAVIIPVSCAVYISACIFILAVNFSAVIPSLGRIFREAFGFSAIGGGFSGAMLSYVIREGFARSLFSNEAGMGSSPLAHATSAFGSPQSQAKWGIFEIFFDTFIVSTLTAVCLLSSGSGSPADMFFSVFGSIGGYIYGALTAILAFASVISWCYYAECCISFMLPDSKAVFFVYRAAFSLAAVAGVFMSDRVIWDIADILNAFMLMPNLFLLFKCRKEIERME
jgi:AGCS family alanine or glycine:cation symporter